MVCFKIYQLAKSPCCIRFCVCICIHVCICIYIYIYICLCVYVCRMNAICRFCRFAPAVDEFQHHAYLCIRTRAPRSRSGNLQYVCSCCRCGWYLVLLKPRPRLQRFWHTTVGSGSQGPARHRSEFWRQTSPDSSDQKKLARIPESPNPTACEISSNKCFQAPGRTDLRSAPVRSKGTYHSYFAIMVGFLLGFFIWIQSFGVIGTARVSESLVPALQLFS